jgi:hypothetical protein
MNAFVRGVGTPPRFLALAWLVAGCSAPAPPASRVPVPSDRTYDANLTSTLPCRTPPEALGRPFARHQLAGGTWLFTWGAGTCVAVGELLDARCTSIATFDGAAIEVAPDERTLAVYTPQGAPLSDASQLSLFRLPEGTALEPPPIARREDRRESHPPMAAALRQPDPPRPPAPPTARRGSTSIARPFPWKAPSSTIGLPQLGQASGHLPKTRSIRTARRRHRGRRTSRIGGPAAGRRDGAGTRSAPRSRPLCRSSTDA